MIKQYIGIDISPSHGAVVSVDASGELLNWVAISNRKKDSGVHNNILYMSPRKKEDRDNYNAYRRNFIFNTVAGCFEHCSTFDTHANIEGYAMGSQSSSVTACAEIGGIVRNFLYNKCSQMETSPNSLKMYVTGKGNARKHAIYSKFFETADETYFGLNEGDAENLIKRGSKDIDGVFTDILDAYYLASLCRERDLLLHEHITLEDFPDEIARVFTKTSKSYPLSLLERPMVYNG